MLFCLLMDGITLKLDVHGDEAENRRVSTRTRLALELWNLETNFGCSRTSRKIQKKFQKNKI
jgi:hypothetical protein